MPYREESVYFGADLPPKFPLLDERKYPDLFVSAKQSLATKHPFGFSTSRSWIIGTATKQQQCAQPRTVVPQIDSEQRDREYHNGPPKRASR